ncbi:MAG: HAD-IA family hydrolase [Kiritimatiellae bacterium]|nr:HAD-IA family hydrolase [Kiritimatiellia bacterium]
MTLVETWLARAATADGVVFDFGGVVTASPLKDWELYPYCAAKGVDRAAVEAGFKNYRLLWDGGFIPFAELYRRIFADAGRPPPDEATLADLWELDSGGWIREIRQDTLDLMRLLKEDGKKIGILSNMSPEFYERLYVPHAAAWRAFVDAEVISGLVNLYKPERPIYDLAARRMGLPPERLLFADDTPLNVEAARRYGWQSEIYSAAPLRA